MKYLSSGQLVTDWGAGYFLCLKFSDLPTGTTYSNVKVGLVPSEGSGFVTLDNDLNAVMKVTSKDMQVFRVITTKTVGETTYTKNQTFSLKGLKLE